MIAPLWQTDPAVPAGSEAGAPVVPPFTHPPVFIRKARAVISWTPKCGCSHVVLWALLHEGLYTQASAEGITPHKFRIHTYQKDPAYRTALARLRREGGAGKTLIRVTRDPGKRLVSIFRHACRRPFLAKYADILGFDPRQEGLSLIDLDRVLGALKLTHPTPADPHLRVQASPLWEMGFDRVITLNMDETALNQGLHAIERDLGLPRTRFGKLAAFGRLRRAHYARAGAWDGSGDLAERRFRADEVETFPKKALEGLPLVGDMVRRHYAADLGRVGSGDSAGRLVFAPRSAA